MELPAGYQLRAPEPGDLDGVAEALTADELAEGGTVVLGTGFVRDEWSRAGFNLATDAWVITDGAGAIAGYVQAMAEEPGTTDCWGVVHPQHRGRGIGAALVSLTQERAARLADGLPSGRLRHVINAGDAAAADLLLASGLHLVRHFWHMQIDLPVQVDPGTMPAGIEIGGIDPAADLPVVKTVIDEAFADHWEYHPEPYDRWVADLIRRPGYDTSLWLLATDAGLPVGALIGHVSEDQGWVDYLAVLAASRGRGVGAALLRRSFAMFAGRGIRRVVLAVDAENTTGATALYERVGMRVVSRFDWWEQPVPTRR
ncbi:MAG TPA: GNAT family N-acetyltransferase [Streptosporangiaceae bacterium]|nr:GNAT family N-acetyltransferase [Streptosporangiaceae bacterium]